MCDVINYSIFYKTVAVTLNDIPNDQASKSNRRKIQRALFDIGQQNNSKRNNTFNTLGKSFRSLFTKSERKPKKDKIQDESIAFQVLKTLHRKLSQEEFDLLSWNELEVYRIMFNLIEQKEDINAWIEFKTIFLKSIKPYLNFYKELKYEQPLLLSICGGKLDYIFWTQLGSPKSAKPWLKSKEKDTVKCVVSSLDKVFEEKNMSNNAEFEKSFYDETPGEVNLGDSSTLSVNDVIERSDIFNRSFYDEVPGEPLSTPNAQGNEENLLNISQESCRSLEEAFNANEIKSQSSPIRNTPSHNREKVTHTLRSQHVLILNEDLTEESSTDPLNDDENKGTHSNKQNEEAQSKHTLRLNNSLEKESGTDPNDSTINLDLSNNSTGLNSSNEEAETPLENSIHDEFLTFSIT